MARRHQLRDARADALQRAGRSDPRRDARHGAVQPQHGVRVGSGRIVVSEIELPNMLAVPV